MNAAAGDRDGPEVPDQEADDGYYVPTPFVVRARLAALAWPLLLSVIALPQLGFLSDAGAVLGASALSVMLLAIALPTLPLAASLPIGAGWIVLVLAAATSLPVWVWGGAALARRIERVHGPDWRRWGLRYLAFPLVALFFAALFIGGLTPMG